MGRLKKSTNNAMGQAKTRRDLIKEGGAVQYRDVADGAIKWGRVAPSIRQQLRNTQELVEAERRGERPAAQVPCNGCVACCHMAKIDFEPALELPETLAHLDYEPDPDKPGGALMRQKDGACVHLGPQGCTVYAYRPRCCRIFDCRLYTAAGTKEVYDDGSTWPTWVPETRTEDDRIYAGALSAASFMEIGKANKAGEKWTAVTMALRAWARLPEIIPVMYKLRDAFKQLPWETREQIANQADEQIKNAINRMQAEINARD